MRLRFTIRDLLWLTIVAALAVGWWLDHARLTSEPVDEFGVEFRLQDSVLFDQQLLGHQPTDR